MLITVQWIGDWTLSYPTIPVAVEILKEEYTKEETVYKEMLKKQDKISKSTSNTQLQEPKLPTNLLFDIVKQVRERKRLSAQENDESEVMSYIQGEASSDDECPLSYWKTNCSKYPLLSNLARKYLAISSSSGGVEREFSIPD